MFPSFSKHKICLAILDIAVLVAGFNFAFWYVFASGSYNKSGVYPVYFIPSIVIITISFLVVFQLQGLYKYQAITNPVHQIQVLLKSYLQVLAAFVLIIFFMKTEYIADSRLTIALGFLCCFFMMVLTRAFVVPRIFKIFVKKGYIKKRTIIFGAGEHGTMVCEYFENSPDSYFEIAGFCDDDGEKTDSRVCGKEVYSRSELHNIVRDLKIDEIIIAIGNIEKGALIDIVDYCKDISSTIHVISDLFSEINEKMEAEEFGGLTTYRIVSKNGGIVHTASKRLMDVVGSSILLVLLSPVLAAIAWAIKKDSQGAIFYKAEVVGKNRNLFMAYKFRSMIENSPQNKGESIKTKEKSEKRKKERDPQITQITQNGQEASRKDDEVNKYQEGCDKHIEFMRDFIQGNNNEGEFFVKDESRITRVGSILRKSSLDELPQLINVFLGEMSLVGPRFCSPKEYEFYKPWHKKRFRVKPGMTGLWQVRARSEVSYDDMVILDLYYIDSQSLLFDFEILLRTIPVVLFGKGSRIT